MAHRLVILEGSASPREVRAESAVVQVGRDLSGDLVLTDRTVSRRHAKICHIGNEMRLEDSGSLFGTFVNDQPVRQGEGITLHDGDILRFGKVRVVCHFDGDDEPSAPEVSDALFAAQANARALVAEGEQVHRHLLAGAVSIVGGSPHCEIQIRDPNAPLEQAVVRARDGRFFIEPRLAAQPPRLNEKQIEVLEPMLLPSNSVFTTGKAQVLFLYDFDSGGKPIDDPVAAVGRRTLLKHAAAQLQCSKRLLAKLSRERRPLGQSLGEMLV